MKKGEPLPPDENEIARQREQQAWRAHWADQRRRLDREDAFHWREAADERNRPVMSPRPINWNQTLEQAMNPPALDAIHEPWDRRSGSDHWPPTDDTLEADRRRCRRTWGHFESLRRRLQLGPFGPHAPVAALDTDGRAATRAYAMVRPLRFRAILQPGSLAAMRVTRQHLEQGSGQSWKSTLLGSRLVISGPGCTPVFEYWIAPCRRPGLENHHEVVNTLLCGWDYKSSVRFDSSDFDIAPICVDGLEFAVSGPRGHWLYSPRIPLGPLLEAEGIDPRSPEAEIGVRHWWVADRGDDGFPYFDIDDVTDEELLHEG